MLETMKDIKPVLITLCVLIVVIIVVKIYLSSKSNGNEGFTSNTPPDLLTKIKSYEAQASAGASNSADLELGIYPWTTKLHNLQTTNQVKAIGLYKPHLTIKGKNYAKLGDMLSQNTDYSPPNKDEFILLLDKPGSDIQPPTDFSKVVQFGNESQSAGFRKFDTFITGNANIAGITGSLANCAAAANNLANVVNGNMDGINMIVREMIMTSVYFNNTGTLDMAMSLWSLFKFKGSSVPYTPKNLSNSTIYLPYGLKVTFQVLHNNNYLDMPQFTPGNGTNINDAIFKQNALNILQTNSTYGLTNSGQGLEVKKLIIDVISLIDPNTIKTYLTGLCNDIKTVMSLTGMSSGFGNYLKLADSLDGVNSILATLNEISGSNIKDVVGYTDFNSLENLPILPQNFVNLFAVNTTLTIYANNHSDTLLGSILQRITNTNIEVNYPIIKFNMLDLQRMGYPEWNPPNFNKTIDFWLIRVTKVKFDSYDLNWVNSSVAIDPFMKSLQGAQSRFNANINETIQFASALVNNQIDYFSLQIYAPQAPKGYIALGHVFCNVASDLAKIKTMNNVACVPEHCIREMRDWVAADKVFEYNQGGIYWALYRNPYTGTFVAVNKPGLPSGKVYKVVACVAKCNAVDELKKADECARTYQKLNQKLEAGTATPDLVASTEESIYLDKIKTQNDNIITLDARARQLQTDINKADIITEEMNKAALQKYVDTQKRNIELVADRLERDQNKIETRITIPIATLNKIIGTIQNLEALSTEQKRTLVDKIVGNAQAANSGLLNQQQYSANLNNILRSCPSYDLTGLVRKSLVGQVCYGCGTPN